MAKQKLTKKYARRNSPLAERLVFHGATPNERGCVLWTGSKGRGGYGQMLWRGKMQKSHRMAWLAAYGPIPDGMCVCHRCDVRACINPAHLFLGTVSDNNADKALKERQSHMRGELCGTAKLTVAQVIEIRAATGALREIAGRFGVNDRAISMIRLRKRWGHVA